MISYILMLLTSVAETGQSVTIKHSKKEKISTIAFNLVESGAACLLFLLLSISSFQVHMPTVALASAYGIFYLLCTVFGYMALLKGPLSITSVVGSASILISFAFGAIVLKETVVPAQIIGLILFFAALYLVGNKEKNLVFQKGWGACILIGIFSGGIGSVVQRMHQIYYPEQYCTEFSFVSMLVMFVILMAVSLIKKEKINKPTVKYGIPAGVFMGMGSFLPLVLSTMFDMTVLYPVMSLLTMLLKYLSSRIIFKEKLNVRQIIGMIIGVIAILLLK